MMALKLNGSAQQYDVVILGAGLSGTLIAMELPSYLNIALIDIGEEIIPRCSTSYNQCNKLHLGLHYAGDIETAQKCLEGSIAFASKYKPYILGKLNDPWRRGRHFIMSNSLFDMDQIQNVCTSLSSVYWKEAKKCNYLFGKPDNFIKFIESNQYPEIARDILFTNEQGDEESVFVKQGIETAESQINIDALKQHFKRVISSSDNITFIPKSDVKKISFDPDTLGHDILIENIETKCGNIIHARSVVNCTWQNIERLDEDKLKDREEKIFVRVKSSILVKLPKELFNLNTCIFSIGPFCSFTNLGNGTAIVTEEVSSNVGDYLAGDEPDVELKSLLQSTNRLERPLGKEMATAILSKASRFIPKLNQASILDLHLGHVKIITKDSKFSLFSPESPIHARLESGVEEKGLGYISASGMKMTYTYHNALIVKDLLAKHEKIKKILEGMLNEQSPVISSDPSFYRPFQYKEFLKDLSLRADVPLGQLSHIFSNKQFNSLLKRSTKMSKRHVILSNSLEKLKKLEVA